jgi:hypothetical protein
MEPFAGLRGASIDQPGAGHPLPVGPEWTPCPMNKPLARTAGARRRPLPPSRDVVEGNAAQPGELGTEGSLPRALVAVI